MKKILFGSAAAICAVVGFSSFKHANTGTATYYIFDAKTGHPATVGVNQPFTNAMIQGEFLATVSLNTQQSQFTQSGCSGSSLWCAAAFTRSQIVTDDPSSTPTKWKLVTSISTPSEANRQFAPKD